MPYFGRPISRLFFWLALLAGLGASSALGQPAPAGAVIENQASITYVDAESGETVTISTNAVATTVNAVEAVALTYDQALDLPPDTFGQFVFVLTNIGNTAASPAIDVAGLPGDFILENLVLTLDVNGNGIADPGEPQLTPGDYVNLAVGGSASIIVGFHTPATAQVGQQGMLQITASGVGATSAATGTVRIAANGLVLEKSVAQSSISVGGTLSYGLRLSSLGADPVPAYDTVDGGPIRIDGAPASGILVRDPIPLNTRLLSAPVSAEFTPLYHLVATPPQSYTTALPADLATVDAIAFFRAGDYPARHTSTMSFEVRVGDLMPNGFVDNTAVTWQRAGAEVVDVDSNTVRTQVTGRAARLSFTIGGVPTEDVALGSRVALLLEAGGCNVTAAPDTVEVEVTTSPQGDLETLTASETGANTGVFETDTILVAPENPVVHESGILAAGDDTTAEASAICAGASIAATLRIDSDEEGMLQLEKTVDKPVAAPGDVLVYTLELTSTDTATLANGVLRDRLPSGLDYLDGSARLEGAPVEVVIDGRELTFALGPIPPGGKLTLTYMVSVGPTAEGEKANLAVAAADGPDGAITSNEGRAVVRVNRTGVFADEGVVLGKVFIDYNRNGIQDAITDPAFEAGNAGIEPGVPGVKLQFSTGASVVTDAEGKYSMPGLPSGSHAVALATRSLLASTVPETSTTRDLLSPRSRYIQMMPGEVRSEYFALVPRDGVTDADVQAELETRRTEYAERLSEAPDSAARLQFGGDAWADYLDGHIIGDGASRPTTSEILPHDDLADAAIGAEGEGPLALARTRDLEKEIRNLSPGLAFMDLKNGDVLGSGSASIRVKGPADGKLALSVNGEPVPEQQVGQRVAYADGGVQAAEYVAVQLVEGSNHLELSFADPFGNVRERQSIELLAPGRPAKIEIVAPPAAMADPSSPIPVLIRIVDAEGRPTYASMDVTLETEGQGRWGEDDIRLTEPGIQVFVDRGEALVEYYPSSLAGTRQLAVRNGLGRFTAEISFEADSSQRIIVGVVEGAVGFGQDVEAAGDGDGFAPVTQGIRGELYLKGKIKGGALLTLRYDSDRDTETRLFRDVDPDRYYPVYGDKSEKGYDAQSRSQLFVKVEHGLNYVLYGDIEIAPPADELQLGPYSRSLTGAQAHAEIGPVTVDLFAGRTNQNQLIREFRAEGLSGPYDLDLTGFVEGSDVVEVITRDRIQPSVILNTARLNRYEDYRLDYFANTILFTDPVPATDDDGNPNFIRITYEVEGDGDAYWIYSGELRYQLSDTFAVGYREVHSEADVAYDDRRMVRSGYASADFGALGRAEFELAQSVDNEGESGTAARLSYELINDDVVVRARASSIGEGFLDGQTASPGHDEASLAIDWRMIPGVDLRTRAVYDRDGTTGDRRYGAEALLDWVLTPELTATGGVRYVYRTPGDGSAARSIPSAVLGGEWTPADIPTLTVKGELEADLTDLSHLRALIEGSHQATEDLRVYARAEWASAGAEFLDFAAADDPGGVLKMGLEYRINADMTSFTELRSGSETGFAGGVDGTWKLSDWAFASEQQVYASLEHFQPMDVSTILGIPFGIYDEDQTPQTSLAAGYRGIIGENGRVAVGGELALKDGGYTAYTQQYWSQGYGDWSWAVENRFAIADTDTQDRLRDHLRVGAALRPEDQSIEGLAMAGVRLDQDALEEIESLTAYWSAGGSWALDGETRLTAKQAGQYQLTTADDVTGETFMLLGQAGFERDFEIGDERRVRFGLNGTVFYDVLGGDAYAGVGGEIGFVPSENVLLSAGYNWTPVDPGALSEVYVNGAYLKLTVKLDDSLWNFFDDAGITVPADGASK